MSIKVAFSLLKSPFGGFLMTSRTGGVITGLEFPETFQLPETLARATPLAKEAEKQLNTYFSGGLRLFDLPLDETLGTPFQRLVWETVLDIPWGHTLSYKEIAERLGKPTAYRAVAQALGANPIPIIIPCHRVRSATGGPGGYTPGLAWKKRLWEVEGIH